MKRKTLDLPEALSDRIEAEARATGRSFNSVAVEKLTGLFLSKTVGHSSPNSPDGEEEWRPESRASRTQKNFKKQTQPKNTP
jgi:hypothetical protein